MKRDKILKKKYEGLIQPEDYKLIPLTQGKYAMVDNEDFDKLKDINWCYNNRYAKNNKIGLMHRYIINTPIDSFTDHINQNGLDNRKSNLRLCNQSQNMANVKPIKNKSSKYKGVYWNKKEHKWYVQIKNKKFGNIFLGVFDNEEEAGRAYDLKAIEIHGEFAVLNFKYNNGTI